MMKTTLLAGAVALAGASLLASAAMAGTNLVADGGFTNPTQSGAYTTYGVGPMGDWTVKSGSVDQIGSYWQGPPGGGNSIDLDGNSPGEISQDLTLAPGEYELSYYLSGNPDNAPSTKTGTITVGGAATSFSYTTGANSHNDMMWQLETFTFTTSGGSTALDIASTDAGGPYGAALGDVSLVAVPEPATWAMLMMGVLAVGAVFRVNRRPAPLAA